MIQTILPTKKTYMEFVRLFGVEPNFEQMLKDEIEAFEDLSPEDKS